MWICFINPALVYDHGTKRWKKADQDQEEAWVSFLYNQWGERYIKMKKPVWLFVLLLLEKLLRHWVWVHLFLCYLKCWLKKNYLNLLEGLIVPPSLAGSAALSHELFTSLVCFCCLGSSFTVIKHLQLAHMCTEFENMLSRSVGGGNEPDMRAHRCTFIPRPLRAWSQQWTFSEWRL